VCPESSWRAPTPKAASLLDGCADERDQPFILGVTNLEVPSYKAVFLALQRKFYEAESMR